MGIADGAHTNWDYLEGHTTTQILDFYHAAEYLTDVALAACPRSKSDRAQQLSKSVKEKLESAITYFRNHKHQMHYARYRAKSMPIGSGVTEAACKTLVKQRLCSSGMKWKERGASIVLRLRALVLTPERWEQFWGKINQYGFQMAA